MSVEWRALPKGNALELVIREQPSRERNEPFTTEWKSEAILHVSSKLSTAKEGKKEKARKRSLHFANAQCQNVIWAFSSNSFKAHYRTSCTFAWLTPGVIASEAKQSRKWDRGQTFGFPRWHVAGVMRQNMSSRTCCAIYGLLRRVASDYSGCRRSNVRLQLTGFASLHPTENPTSQWRQMRCVVLSSA